MMAGIDYSSGDVIIPMDGDLQNDPNDIPRLLAKIAEGYDVCSGWRKDRKDNTIKRNIPSKIANVIISWISGVHLHDYGCSLKAYKKSVIKDVKLYGEMHRFHPYLCCLARGKDHGDTRQARAAHSWCFKYGIERTLKVVLDLIVVKFLSRYSQKPIYVFGAFGVLNLFAAFCAGILALYYKFFRRQVIYRNAVAALCRIDRHYGHHVHFYGPVGRDIDADLLRVPGEIHLSRCRMPKRQTRSFARCVEAVRTSRMPSTDETSGAAVPPPRTACCCCLGLFVFVRVSLRKPRWRAEAVAAASSAVPMPRRCCR